MLFDEIAPFIEGHSTPAQFSTKIEPVTDENGFICVHTIPIDVMVAINNNYQQEIDKIHAKELQDMAMMDKTYSA